jgi:hypothetical protein
VRIRRRNGYLVVFYENIHPTRALQAATQHPPLARDARSRRVRSVRRLAPPAHRHEGPAHARRLDPAKPLQNTRQRMSDGKTEPTVAGGIVRGERRSARPRHRCCDATCSTLLQ